MYTHTVQRARVQLLVPAPSRARAALEAPGEEHDAAELSRLTPHVLDAKNCLPPGRQGLLGLSADDSSRVCVPGTALPAFHVFI